MDIMKGILTVDLIEKEIITFIKIKIMDYVILILLILVILFLLISLGLIVLGACPTDEEIEMWEEIDNPDLAHKKRDANFVWTDKKTNKLD